MNELTLIVLQRFSPTGFLILLENMFELLNLCAEDIKIAVRSEKILT